MKGTRSPPSRRPAWVALAVAVFLIGGLASLLGARTLADRDSAQSAQNGSIASSAIASTLQLALQHEQDLAISSGGFLAGNPTATASQYDQWVASQRALHRYPELDAIAVIVLVPAADLTAFAARESADPAGSLGSTGTLVVSPAGTRPYYCLETGSVTRPGALVGGAGVDYCDSALGPALLLARDSGKDTYLPYGSGPGRDLAVGSAIYSGGLEPTTVAARRAGFLGWTGTQIAPAVLMDAALVGHPDTSLTFRYGSGTGAVVFTAGHAPDGARTTTVDLHNGWFVATSAAVTGSSLLANQNSRAVLLGGLVISLLLALLIYALGTSRTRAVLMVRDRTEELQHLAYHDALTGLPNRVLILDRLEQMMLRSRREDAKVGALYLDLDNFKDVNDTLGHAAGDQLLMLVANRLSQVLREGDTVGRLGGDEFVILIDGNSLDDGPSLAAQRILDVMAQPFQLELTEMPVTMTASIGIAEGVRDQAEDLLRDADIALNRAKASGKHQTVIFAPRMQDAVDAHRSLETDLRGALAAGQFFLLYQPIFELDSGRVSGVEALIRWRHPDRGVVGPAEFIPSLESTGLIVPVGRWVMGEACRQGAAWQEVGHLLTMSVNLSAHQLEDGQLLVDVRQALESSGFAPDRLVLELTETILMHDVPSTIDQLAHLKSIGVRISIDDFGTGYSSFAYLRKFPIDILKIDQAFVSSIADTWESAAIVHTLVQLGKVLGLEIVAEGIETEDQRARLRAEEVDLGQGYLFARPLESAVIDYFLEMLVTTPVVPA